MTSSAALCRPGGFREMYPWAEERATVEHAEKYVNELFEASLRPRLTDGERRLLAGMTIRAVSPTLFAATLDTLGLEVGESCNPTQFFTPRRGEILVPTLSMLFLHDLTKTANVLWDDGFTPDSALTYLVFVRHSTPASVFADRSTFPRIHEALGIPLKRIEGESTGTGAMLTNAALSFALGHELWHALVFAGAEIDSVKCSGRNAEICADEFAAALVLRDELPASYTNDDAALSAGVAFYFTANSIISPNRNDYASDDAFIAARKRYTHPVSGQRIEAIADLLDRRVEAWTKTHMLDLTPPSIQITDTSAASLHQLARRMDDPRSDLAYVAAILSNGAMSFLPVPLGSTADP